MFPSALRFNFFHNIIFVGIAIGLLLGIVLLSTPRFRQLITLFLGIFLISFSLNNLYYFFIDIHLDIYVPVLAFVPLSVKTLIPVSAYCYILLTLYPDRSLSVKHWLLFLVPVMQFSFYTFLAVLYCFSSQMLTANFNAIERMYRLDELLSVVITMVLTIAIAKQVLSCRQDKQHNQERLGWAIQFFLLGTAAVLLWAIPFLHAYVTKSYRTSAFYPMWSFSSVIVCWIGARGFRQPSFFEKRRVKEKEGATDPDSLFRRQLREVMLSEKPHQNPELTVKDLANALGISVNKLRKVIKTESGNYHGFVNEYRVEEAKGLLTDSQNAHFTIEAIGEMAGFRSRATFFSAFKQHTGETPQQYQHSHLKVRHHRESK